MIAPAARGGTTVRVAKATDRVLGVMTGIVGAQAATAPAMDVTTGPVARGGMTARVGMATGVMTVLVAIVRVTGVMTAPVRRAETVTVAREGTIVRAGMATDVTSVLVGIVRGMGVITVIVAARAPIVPATVATSVPAVDATPVARAQVAMIVIVGSPATRTADARVVTVTARLAVARARVRGATAIDPARRGTRIAGVMVASAAADTRTVGAVRGRRTRVADLHPATANGVEALVATTVAPPTVVTVGLIVVTSVVVTVGLIVVTSVMAIVGSTGIRVRPRRIASAIPSFRTTSRRRTSRPRHATSSRR